MNNILSEKQYQAEILGILRNRNGYIVRKSTNFDSHFAMDRGMLINNF